MLLRTILFLALFSIPVVASAEDKSVVPDNVAKVDIAKAKSRVLNKKIVGILKDLTQEEAVHFLTIYSNYNIYSTVKAVRNDVQGAVKACAKNNKSMASNVNSRFAKWAKNVGVSMAASNDVIQNLALAQTYISQSELRVIFGLADELRAVNSSRFETIPVTTPEACKFMLSKMDETEKQMTSMLRATVASYADVRKRTQK